jgi:hypothetical protein
VIKALRAYTIPILLILLAMPQAASAQVRPVGIIWDPPEMVTQARAEIELMRQNAISHVYTTTVPSDELLQILRNNQMRLLVQHPVKYLTTWHLEHHRQELKSDILEHWNRLRSYPYLSGYSLFFEGALHRPDFVGLVSELRPPGMPDQIAFFSSDFDPPSGYSIPMNRLGLVQSIDEATIQTASDENMNFLVLVTPSDNHHIGQWYELLKSTGSGRLYLKSEILFSKRVENVALLNLINEIQSDPEYLLSVAPTPDEKHQDGYSIFIFLVIIVIFGIHYAFDPTYRKSLQRFFLSNRIFVDDLVQRRAKLTFSNYIVILYISLLSGTFLMSIAEFKVSTSGVELLSHFVPFLSSDNVLVYAFMTGSTISVLVMSFLILWGAYMNKGTTQFMSYVTIILWPNHVLFGLVVLSIVLARILNDPYIAAILSVIVVVLPIFSYGYGGIKLIRYSFRSGLPYLIFYFVPPFVILASLVWWLITQTPIIQLAELTIRLP